MNCVVLFGGQGTRLKHLGYQNKAFIEVNDKPVFYYIVNNLLKSFKKEDLILVTNPIDEPILKNSLREFFNYDFKIITQNKASGTPDAVFLSKELISSQYFSVCLGDFYSLEIPKIMRHFKNENLLVLNKVKNPEKYGVYCPDKKIIFEKPQNFIGSLAVRGFYIYNQSVLGLIPSLKVSKRGETEISDLNNLISFSTVEIDEVIDLGSEEGLSKLKSIQIP